MNLLPKKKPVTLGVLIAATWLFGSLGVGLVQAERMESHSYVIQFGNFNMSAGKQNSTSYKLTNSMGQIAAGPYGQYGSSGYFVGGGFQYIYQIGHFSFSLSKTAINLGTLTYGSLNTDSHTLTINTRGAGYTIYAYEKHPLKLESGSTTIPDTTCDDGSCSETQASSWVNNNIGGFGFNVNGPDAASDFVDSNYYRQFADQAKNEPMQAIMSSANLAVDDQATVTYKAGLTSGSQAAGNYSTYVSYVAVPSY